MLRLALGPTVPPIQYVIDVFFVEVQRLWRDAEYSDPSRTDIRREWRYTSTSRYASMASAGTN
jgi:hypothetical protein